MSDNMDNKDKRAQNAPEAAPAKEEYSLNDDRRVKVLSPGRMVLQRFLRNRLAVVGMVMLIVMFVFSFIGGIVSPYAEDEQFYTTTALEKEYAAMTRNEDYRFDIADGQEFGSVLQAQLQLAMVKNQTSFTYRDVTYDITEEGTDFYSVSSGGTMLAIAYKDVVNEVDTTLSFNVKLEALRLYTSAEDATGSFTADGTEYTLDADGNISSGSTVVGYISRFVVSAASSDVVLTREFKERLQEAAENDETELDYTDADGTEHHYTITYDASKLVWSIGEDKDTYVYDSYSSPTLEHWLGTDKNGMDVLTRLMYGGRVSLVIGFIVVIIETVLGVILGGVSGYFGGWVDNLIMRIVDIFYCIPSTPLIIILGSAMDGMNVDPQIRMVYLMLILGFLGWPGIARLVRGQILSLREQEFMTAAEACGISASRRIFRHLIPNAIPQLIVTCTMSLGNTILMEATLSFLGLGVKFPFASWGNIISDVTDSFVMTHYWFVWIPAGICLLISVLGFNFVGDGLRDAFDPKMKR